VENDGELGLREITKRRHWNHEYVKEITEGMSEIFRIHLVSLLASLTVTTNGFLRRVKLWNRRSHLKYKSRLMTLIREVICDVVHHQGNHSIPPLFKNLESLCHNNYFEFEFQSSLFVFGVLQVFPGLFVWLCFLKLLTYGTSERTKNVRLKEIISITYLYHG
jgi:hypothetical protein